ncbi:MAG TPA: ubiquinone/menaquinone biosynthesis methyltransferase [Planctomycetota bacterium]|jgi:demethylmenaquinone methyltransferase/2-methoxy-6-polyprenyl-1,4-benzoquinol methylase|nr:ubiquinone/menaquinone biosynthesis methyltransferase [Planctomycetota bacterium]
MPEPVQVRSMFARIAGRYDLLNRVLSVGIDRRWRRAAVERGGALDERLVVDACCGTGDLALEYARRGARVVGVDFTPEMLARAGPKRKAEDGACVFVHGDALSLPVAAGAADVCSVAFGLRNVADRRLAMGEMLRVVRPGGRLVVLEFSTPPGRWFGGLYRLYFTRLLPLVGRCVSRHDDAYRYLPRTVLEWPRPGALQAELEQSGWIDCGYALLTGGIACLHWGRAPEGDRP